MNVKSASELSELVPAGTGEKLSVADTPVSFAEATLPATSRKLLVSVSTKLVSVTFDGTAPDTAVGIELPVGYVGVWSKELAAAAKFHQGSGGAGVVYGQPLA